MQSVRLPVAARKNKIGCSCERGSCCASQFEQVKTLHVSHQDAFWRQISDVSCGDAARSQERLDVLVASVSFMQPGQLSLICTTDDLSIEKN